MRRHEAKEIVDSGDFTKDALLQILKTARGTVTNWEARSKINPSLSRGTAFNIMWKGVSAMSDDSSRGLRLIAINVLREFGDAGKYKSRYPKAKASIPVCHQEPLDPFEDSPNDT